MNIEPAIRISTLSALSIQKDHLPRTGFEKVPEVRR